MEDLTGKQFGPYQIVAPLGEGGMAVVYKAFQPAMERYVAIKVLPRALAQDPEFVARFQREAKLLAQLQHPHILPVFDFGEAEGFTYLVMPYIKSGTLTDLLRGGVLPLEQTRRLITQIGDALHYAHTRGLVHRDVKPSNVLVDESGNCLLTDFGLARMVEGSMNLTTSGTVLGTPAYMSPEQGVGQPSDARSDIYALGVILYEMVTGRVPYKAETPVAVIFKHIHDPLPPPSTVNPAISEALEAVILKALAKKPDDRYSTAGDMVKALQTALSAETPARHPVSSSASALPTPPSALARTASVPPTSAASPSSLMRWIGVGCIGLAVIGMLGAAGLGVFLGLPALLGAPRSFGTPTLTASPRPAASATTAATPPPVITSEGTIKIVSDLPMTGASLGQTTTIVNAIQMALEEANYQACGGAWTVEYEAMDDASAERGTWDADVVTANAGRYVADERIVAVIGPFNSGAARILIPALNPAQLVIVSASNTYPGLTKPLSGVDDEPDKYYPTGLRNYARVSVSDDMQGKVAARWAQTLGASSVYVAHDGDVYGTGIAAQFRAEAEALGLEVVAYTSLADSEVGSLAAEIAQTQPGLVFFGGITQNGAGELFRALREAGYTGLLMGADGIQETAFIETAGEAAEGVYSTFPGLTPDRYTGRAMDWLAAYEAKFGAKPEFFGIYGYVVTQVILDAFDRVCAAGQSPADREAVREAVLSTQNFESVIGTFSFDANGDTTLIAMTGSQVQDGQWVFAEVLEAESITSPNPLFTLAQAEGSLSVIALPHDWANYGEIIEVFQEKYNLPITELNPDAGSADEIEAIRANIGHSGPEAPDVVDVGLGFALSAKDEGLLAPYKVSTWDTIPDEFKDADGYWCGGYYGIIAFEVNADIVTNVPQDWADLLNPEYKGMIALAGNPTVSSQAVNGVLAAALANGGSLDKPLPGLEFFAQLYQSGNFVTTIGDSSTLVSGETPILIRWDYNALAHRDAEAGATNIVVQIPQSGVLAGGYALAISAYAPRPNAAKLWMEFMYSDEGQLLWLKGYVHPARYEDLIARGVIPAELLERMPSAEAYVNAQFPTPDQSSTARQVIADNWARIVLGQ